MINIFQEQLLTLTQAAKLTTLPVRRNSKRPNVATLHRWATRGLRGVRLQTIQVGGTKCTTLQALQEFFDTLGKLNVQADSNTKGSALRHSQQADAELKGLGF